MLFIVTDIHAVNVDKTIRDVTEEETPSENTFQSFDSTPIIQQQIQLEPEEKNPASNTNPFLHAEEYPDSSENPIIPSLSSEETNENPLSHHDTSDTDNKMENSKSDLKAESALFSDDDEEDFLSRRNDKSKQLLSINNNSSILLNEKSKEDLDRSKSSFSEESKLLGKEDSTSYNPLFGEEEDFDIFR
jgi:hypothetical protein